MNTGNAGRTAFNFEEIISPEQVQENNEKTLLNRKAL